VRPSQLLDPADRQRIAAALFEAHKTTRGEIAVVVVRASDAYAGAPWRLGLLLALAASFGLAAFAPRSSLEALLALQALALASGHALARVDAVRRRLVTSQVADESVDRRASRAFAETGLHRHAERAGVLLFVSLLERRVRVLGDAGIEDLLPGGERWQDLLEPIVEAMREGRAADGLVESIERCGALLAVHFPGARETAALPGLVLEDSRA
jgi:putative membrane protein